MMNQDVLFGETAAKPVVEGEATKSIEHVTSRAPSIAFLGLAGASMALALALFLKGKRDAGIFVGLWPLAMLSIGNYNKLVKVLGSDRGDRW